MGEQARDPPPGEGALAEEVLAAVIERCATRALVGLELERLGSIVRRRSLGVEEHRKKAEEEHRVLRSAIVTVSDTRTLETDESGLEMVRQLERAGHQVVERAIVPDDPGRIALVLRHWLSADIEAVLLNGGTGIAPRDGTVEVVRQFLDRELPGFGELFRMLSYQQVGPAAMLTRAVAGIARGKAVFVLPGSRKAVELGMEKLIVPEIRHIAHELRK